MDKYRPEVMAFLKKVTQEGREFFVYDTETTGLDVEDSDIIEFSALKCGYNPETNRFVIKDTLDVYINVGYPLSNEIQKLTGITDLELHEKGIQPGEAAELVKSFFGDNPLLTGYNSIYFDTAFVAKLYKEQLGEDFQFCSQLDILTMAREKTPGKHKLADMAEKAQIKDLQFHRSIDDCKATLGVLVYLLPMYRLKEPDMDIAYFRVTEVSRWTKSVKLDRIYVKNNMEFDVYYDLFSKSWKIWTVGVNCDEEMLKAKIYLFTGVGNEKLFVEKYASE